LLTKEQLAADVKAGKIDTVIVAFTDMQGRLMGKRVDGEYFVESAAHGEPTEGCNYLLTVDMEMDPVPGYEMASWERGYGDFDLLPDFATLRRIPWLEATALVLSDVAWHGSAAHATCTRACGRLIATRSTVSRRRSAGTSRGTSHARRSWRSSWLRT
jgi:glutamine synthetase